MKITSISNEILEHFQGRAPLAIIKELTKLSAHQQRMIISFLTGDIFEVAETRVQQPSEKFGAMCRITAAAIFVLFTANFNQTCCEKISILDKNYTGEKDLVYNGGWYEACRAWGTPTTDWFPARLNRLWKMPYYGISFRDEDNVHYLYEALRPILRLIHDEEKFKILAKRRADFEEAETKAKKSRSAKAVAEANELTKTTVRMTDAC